MPVTTDVSQGLPTAQAQQRLQSDGYNDLPSSKPRPWWAMAWKIISEPMFLLLISCGGIYLLLGSVPDALILLASVFIIMGMSFVQERKSEQALAALRELASAQTQVVRDGVQQAIASRDLVCGDIIVLNEGERVPADALIITCQNLTVDESLLSGESVAVRKVAASEEVLASTDKVPPAGGDDLPYLCSGSMLGQGDARAQVMAIGKNTSLGQIGDALASLPDEASRVQQETRHAVKLIAFASGGLALLLALWYGSTRGDWLNGILAALTMAMSLLPAEFPLILTIFLGLGAWRIAQKKVLTRHISAIEMLGSASVLCVDKTGTLTQNRMAVAQLIVAEEVFAFSDDAQPAQFAEKFHETLEFAMLSSHRKAFDPMEQAIQQRGNAALAGSEHIHTNWKLVEQYPLSPELLAMSRVWQSPDLVDRHDYVIAAKGAPEAIMDLCHLDAAQIASLAHQVDLAAGQGLRVLAVAKASFYTQAGVDALPEIQHDFAFQFLGLIALADPLRASVPAAIAECHAAGIRVMMMTGDYPATALSIAKQSGLDTSAGVMTGSDLSELDDAAFAQRLAQVNVFCRVQPEQKLRLVQALKNAGQVVAMTGDGVNDAPALKAAHIGIAMGGHGTDVAREAASIVLLEDDFNAIVAAVKLGRRIFDNIQKAVVFVVAAHIPIAGMSLVPVIMGWPLILLPVHIVFFELMVEPTCSIVFEAEQEEENLMQRPPRPSAAKIFEKSLLLRGVQQGIVLLLVLLVVYITAQEYGANQEQARALTFSTMIIGDIWLILLNRSWHRPLLASLRLPNPIMWWVIGTASALLCVALYVPMVSRLFHFQTPSTLQLVLAAALMSFSLVLSRALSRAFSRREPVPPAAAQNKGSELASGK